MLIKVSGRQGMTPDGDARRVKRWTREEALQPQ